MTKKQIIPTNKQPTNKQIIQRTLKFVNSLRKCVDAPALTELPQGARGKSLQCPISVALKPVGRPSVGGDEIVWGKMKSALADKIRTTAKKMKLEYLFTEEEEGDCNNGRSGRYGVSMVTPAAVDLFIAAFDDGDMLDLIKSAKDRKAAMAEREVTAELTAELIS